MLRVVLLPSGRAMLVRLMFETSSSACQAIIPVRASFGSSGTLHAPVPEFRAVHTPSQRLSDSTTSNHTRETSVFLRNTVSPCRTITYGGVVFDRLPLLLSSVFRFFTVAAPKVARRGTAPLRSRLCWMDRAGDSPALMSFLVAGEVKNRFLTGAALLDGGCGPPYDRERRASRSMLRAALQARFRISSRERCGPKSTFFTSVPASWARPT